MEDSQDSGISFPREPRERDDGVKKENSGSEDNFTITTQQIINQFELEIQTLERDIRQQKESSANAKTAITFEQLKKIHNISRLLGPHKETFFDRICRAAEIQRASLKNRLKQNKDRFEPQNCLSATPTVQFSTIDSQNSVGDSQTQTYLVTPNLQNIILFNNPKEIGRALDMGPSAPYEEEIRIPADRQYDLLKLGFSYEELKQLIEVFDKFKQEYKKVVKPLSASSEQVMNQFSNFISMSPADTEHLRLISIAFNLLELGNPRRDVQRIVIKERRKQTLEMDDDVSSKRSCLSPPSEQFNERDSTSPLDRDIERDELVLGIQSDD